MWARLPHDALELLARIGDDLQSDVVNLETVAQATQSLGQLGPGSIAETEYCIALAAGLTTVHDTANWRLLNRLGGPDKRDSHPHLELLRRHAELALLFLTHRNGYVRQAALQVLPTSITGPFWVAALFWRLNDWNSNVRAAAVEAAKLRLPNCAVDDLARVAFALFERMPEWRRWSAAEYALVQNAIERRDVVEQFVNLLKQRDQGGSLRSFRAALRKPLLDAYLLDLFQRAHLPDVRATALRAMLTGKAKWASGYELQWVEKAFGRSRQVPMFATRALTRDFSRLQLLNEGAADTSAVVRRVVAKSLFDAPEPASVIDPLIGKLLVDRSAVVRWHADFARRHRSQSKHASV